MDFSGILQDLLTTPTEAPSEHTTTITAVSSSSNTRRNKKLCLLLGHGLAVHEIFFTENIHQFLQLHYPTLTTVQSYGDKQNNNNSGGINSSEDERKNSSSKRIPCNIIIICLHKSWDIYRKLLNPIYTSHPQIKESLHIIDMTVGMKEILSSSSISSSSNQSAESNLPEQLMKNCTTSDVQPNIEDSMIRNYIKNKVDKLLKPSSCCSEGDEDSMKSTGDQNVGIFIDNLTALYDLGVSVRELENMLSSWWWCYPHSNVDNDSFVKTSSSSSSTLFMHIGIHVGDNFEDSIISEYEPAFVHFIDMWRRRASNVIEVKPLTTGYTSLIDGQLICWKQTSNVDNICASTSNTYHFRVEGKRINCYTPGMSKLLT
ncbi:unnamed protein product [Trichobilharzia szidati]|nr:unnamed protein product [Trichobilharzia szidati]